MIFEYFLHTINSNNTYTVIVKHNNTNIAVNIDFIKNYPSYVFIHNTYNNSKCIY